jgi:mRNA interferase MazF
VSRIDVCLVGLDPTVGSEIQKTRPCLVVSPDETNRLIATVVVAPMTTRGGPYLSRVPCRFRGKAGWVVLDRLRTVDKGWLVRRLGRLSAPARRAVLATLAELFAEQDGRWARRPGVPVRRRGHQCASVAAQLTRSASTWAAERRRRRRRGRRANSPHGPQPIPPRMAPPDLAQLKSPAPPERITTIASLLQRQVGAARGRVVLADLLSRLQVAVVTERTIRPALAGAFRDLEDAVCHAAALEAGAELMTV